MPPAVIIAIAVSLVIAILVIGTFVIIKEVEPVIPDLVTPDVAATLTVEAATPTVQAAVGRPVSMDSTRLGFGKGE